MPYRVRSYNDFSADEIFATKEEVGRFILDSYAGPQGDWNVAPTEHNIGRLWLYELNLEKPPFRHLSPCLDYKVWAAWDKTALRRMLELVASRPFTWGFTVKKVRRSAT